MRHHNRLNATMRPGDTYTRRGYGVELDVTVTILAYPVKTKDIFGTGIWQAWATRDDIGTEGWVQFGSEVDAWD